LLVLIFINRFHTKAGLRVFLGKGEAREIIEETTLIARQKNIDLKTVSKQAIYSKGDCTNDKTYKFQSKAMIN